MESIRGKIDDKRTETKTSQKTGKPYTKTFLKIAGVEYNQFKTTAAMIGDEVTIEFETSNWGNDIKTLTAHKTAERVELEPSRSGPAPKKSEKRPETAAEQFQVDLQRIQARHKALDVMAQSHNIAKKPITIDVFIKEAEVIENWIMRDPPKIHEGGSLQIIIDTIVDMVQASKDGKVPCDKMDKRFMCDPETRDKAYKMAQEGKQVQLLNGFWLDVARKGAV